MKEKVKKLWLKALRSGEYKQTTGELKNEKGYCCLGVLTDLHRIRTKKAGCTWKFDDNYNNYQYKGETAVLPQEVCKWAGLDLEDAEISVTINKKNRRSLIELNDNGKSFKQIANIIEKHL